jgi:hypothetical protein
MTDEDCPRLDVSEIPLLKDIRCIMKDTKNVAESSYDKRLNRFPLDIAMNIGFGSDHTSKEYRSLCHPPKKANHTQYVAFIFMHA